MHSKAQNRKKVYRNRPIERASEYHSPHHIYISLLRMRAIHELKNEPTTCEVSYFQRTLLAHAHRKSYEELQIQS